MTAISVTDITANRELVVGNASKVIGRSKARKKIFELIYKGQKKYKTQEELRRATGLTITNLLTRCDELATEHLITRTKKNGKFVFGKVKMYSRHKDRIVNQSGNEKKIKKYINKFTNTANAIQINVKQTKHSTKQITINEIDSFNKVKGVRNTNITTQYGEKIIKEGIQKIIGQPGTFKDWGGEKNDLFSTNIKYNSKRYPVAFAFKGKATKGKLTPKSLGKHGDQIQRLFESPAEIFIVLYQGEIEQSVIQQMEVFAVFKSISTGKKIYYCVIDRQDTDKIITAYKSKF